MTAAASPHALTARAEIGAAVVFQDELRSELASAVAAVGDHGLAAELVRELRSPVARALTLDAVTQRAPDQGYRRLVAETVGTSEWLWVLPAVQALDPDALREFCDGLLGAWPG